VAALGCLVTSTQALAAESCHKINAKGVGQDLGGGQTVADIKGGGLLNGTTKGSFAPPTPTSKPNVVALNGSVVFTTNKATLTVTVTGTFNISTGDFTASGPVTASTGKLEGATGNLTLTGKENLPPAGDGSFTETVTGNICVDLAP
jgi:hypothetical protein